MTRRLFLRSEHLAELTSGELTLVVGGLEPTGNHPTFNVQQCVTLITDLFTGTTTTSFAPTPQEHA